ncbi:hypothetical protein D3C79_978150 [compost metagenome]
MLDQVGDRPRVHFDAVLHIGLLQGAAQHHHTLVRIRPLAKGQDLLEGVAAHDQGVDGGHVRRVTVVVTGAGGDHQPVQFAAFTGDEAIEAGGDVDGSFQGHGAASLQEIAG